MAEGRVTKALRILTPASELGRAWTEAISAAAHQRGWTASWSPEAAAENTVLFAASLRAGDAPHDWIMLADDPRAIWAEEVRAGGDAPSPRDFLLAASRRLAAAAAWAGGGARVIDASGSDIELPSLGRVSRYDAGPPPRTIQDPALDLYAVLPPPIGTTASWGLDLFSYPVGHGFDGGAPDMDLTGRARILVHGPYIELPPGVWEVRLEFAIDPMGKPLKFRFDWGVGDDMVTAQPVLDRPGRYSITLSRRWIEAGSAQARVWMMQGAFDGRFHFQRCDVRRLAEDVVTPSDRVAAA